jgi:membrane protease YdiL (CAAX protease family)
MEEKMVEEPQAKPIPWTVWDMAKGIGLVIVFTILISFGLGIGTTLLVGSDALLDITPKDMTITELIAEFFDLLESEGLLHQWLIIVFVGMIFGEGAMVFGAWRFSVFKYRRGWGALGFRRFKVKRGLILAGVVVLVGLLISFLYEMLMTSDESVTMEFTETGLGLAIIAVLAVVVAPVAEETFFRGFLFSGLGNRYGYGWGAVFSALIFSLAHILQPGAFLPIFFLGLLLAWLYMKTGSIWACIFTHFAYNSIALIFMII